VALTFITLWASMGSLLQSLFAFHTILCFVMLYLFYSFNLSVACWSVLLVF